MIKHLFMSYLALYMLVLLVSAIDKTVRKRVMPVWGLGMEIVATLCMAWAGWSYSHDYRDWQMVVFVFGFFVSSMPFLFAPPDERGKAGVHMVCHLIRFIVALQFLLVFYMIR